uniref:Uncharacterized protein n=1 Tax=Rhizophora mucronata TaxID=61149 RepID=A0A2P2MXR6_RHIMU
MLTQVHQVSKSTTYICLPFFNSFDAVFILSNLLNIV